jgi:hypothetical protein
MLGLAGIGHFFLRLYDSEKIASILLLRPQHTRKPQAKAESVGGHVSSHREHA